MKKSYRPNRFDFDAVSPDASIMQLGNQSATRDGTIETHNENEAAAEEVEEDEENAEVEDVASRNIQTK